MRVIVDSHELVASAQSEILHQGRFAWRDVSEGESTLKNRKKCVSPALVGPCNKTGNRSTLMARTMLLKFEVIDNVSMKFGSSRGGQGPYLIQNPSTEHASDSAMCDSGGGFFSSPRGGSIAHDVSELYMNPLHEGSS